MSATMLGSGLYDAPEIARLLGSSPAQVVRWSADSQHGPAIVTPTFDRLFAFADLVSFRVAGIIRSQGISDRDLRRGVQVLRERTGDDRPLAVAPVIARLATSGNSFLAESPTGEYEDIGRGGQGVFQDIVHVYLKRISFDETGLPMRWEPFEGVVIDPAIQAGAPCLSGTRIPTSAVADLLDSTQPDDVALDFDLSLELLRIAEEFESLLQDGVGLPA